MRHLRAGFALLLSTILAATLLVATEPSGAEAADRADFDAGYIISDELFFDGDAMSASAIQSFFSSQVRSCQAGYTCLKDYRQHTPAMPGSIYCDSLPERRDQTAAQILSAVATACDVSPRVLIVLLQKEQSLVTLTAPSPIRYTRATGFACPDTAPCDSSYGGFFYQIYYAARQFQRYAAHPANYQHRAGQTNRVLYHPNAACGSSPVLIRNQATAGLYNYTPYQPNAAALNNLYGTGDACSAYGNRNFWRMWTDWFGSTTGDSIPPQTLLARAEGSSTVYLINGDFRHPFPNATLLAEYSSRLGDVEEVTARALESLTLGQAVTRYLRDGRGGSFYVDEGRKYRFQDCNQLVRWGQGCHVGIWASTQILDRMWDAGALRDIVGWSGEWWHISGGERHRIMDTDIIGALGMSYANSWMSAGALHPMPIGRPLLAEGFGVAAPGRGSAVLQTASGQLQLDAGQLRLSVFAGIPTTDAASFAAVGPATRLHSRIDYGSTAWVVTDRGLLQVSKTGLGGQAYFTQMAYPSLRGVPIAGSALGEHFQAEVGSSTVWWLHDGKREPVAASQVAAIAQRERIPATVHRGAPGYLNWIPEHSSFPVGTLLRDAQSGQLLLTSRTSTLRVDSVDPLRQLGLDTTPTSISRSVRNGLPATGVTVDDFGVRCGSAPLLASSGLAHGFANTSSAAAWGFTYELLPADVCALIRTSGERTGPVVTGPEGDLWLIRDGVRQPVDSQRTVSTISGAAGLTQSSVGGHTLYALPRGAMVKPYWYSGTLVQGYGQSQPYLVDQGTLLATSPTVSWELGFRGVPTGVPQEAIAVSGAAGTLPSTLVSCSGVRYAAIDQRLVRMRWADSLHFGAANFTELSPTTCGKVPVSGWMSRLIADASGQVWLVENGQRRLVQSQAAADGLAASGSDPTRQVDTTMLAALPIGAPVP